MTTELTEAVRYCAVTDKNKKFDSVFYFAITTSDVYCRPSCIIERLIQPNYSFFGSINEAELQGYQACKVCHPDRLRNNLSSTILEHIDAGAINEKGVYGLANSLHISERHLRRLVHDRTGTSPARLNKTKRLNTAQRLITDTKLPITDVAFKSEFSSLRQFNYAFREAFKMSPHEMRKSALNCLSKS